jgi:hypothetical protein
MTYFEGAQGVNIHGGTFGPDHSRHITHHGDVHHTTDQSWHQNNHASGPATDRWAPGYREVGPLFHTRSLTDIPEAG